MTNPRMQTHLKHYDSMLGWVNAFLKRVDDADLEYYVQEGGNHGVYILAHLVCSDDETGYFLGEKELLWPDLLKQFGMGTDCPPVSACPPVAELREMWEEICGVNREIYLKMTDAELDQPHARMAEPPETDFFKTKEGILIHFGLHQVYHAGQLGLLLRKAGKKYA